MSALTLTVSTSTATTNTEQQHEIRRHARYWLEDGSLVVRAQDDFYKVHRTLLHRHSKVLAALGPSPTDDGHTVDGLVVVHIPDALEVRSADFEALLEHLYHDAPIDDTAPFTRVASVLRASAKEQLDFPAIHALARTRLEGMFPADPESAPFAMEHAEEALTLAVKHDIPSIRKALYYSIATHSHDHGADDPNAPAPRLPLSPELSARCDALLDNLIAHFTPILFTVATAGHMACTDVFAEKWMPLVIQRALDENGLCRPLETLEEIIAIDWAAEGLCEECVRDKREEWRGEQKDVWARMDGWLS
ncbi:uncharacterized protein TRAVEDRAFT_154698 [Trametes versicolor FP-101664 SS1]|uniref:uncharacterized protein n=1 Tax=Trametes versicolor (strain FP-101664) TaxID=717944 RepID=UPI0004621D8A|nr:uncharacterized protein TRAVEDRAFT_154698 [Trametes versicolor FP-101664 SS1]EIW53294.1 hypothetical protein TRAVEDRAFT_154698 [Trametes versicolor FP-101664 SS1]